LATDCVILSPNFNINWLPENDSFESKKQRAFIDERKRKAEAKELQAAMDIASQHVDKMVRRLLGDLVVHWSGPEPSLL
jgi:hypothetical protein